MWARALHAAGIQGSVRLAFISNANQKSRRIQSSEKWQWPSTSLQSTQRCPTAIQEQQLLSHLGSYFQGFTALNISVSCVKTPLQLTRWEYNYHFRYFSTASTWLCPVFKWLIQLVTNCFSPPKTAETYFHPNACPQAKAKNQQRQNKQKKQLWSFCQHTVA